jgi:phytoene desaturase
MAEKASSAVIIGGGLAGLAASVELARRGVEVTLVEKNRHLGGKMNVLERDGFTFDMGPTILTLPEVIRGVIERAGRRVEDYIEFIELDPQWRCVYEDGTVLDLRPGVDAMSRALEEQFPGTGSGEGYRRFLEFSRRMRRLSEQVFFYKDVGAIPDVMRQTKAFDPSLLRDVLGMRLHSTVGSTAHRMITEPHVRQMVEHFLQYVGSSPFLAPAILSLIASVQADEGCWYARGGTRQVARGLARLGEELGVEHITGVGVSSVMHDGRRALGVALEDGRSVKADVVVSNCDVQRTLRDLVKAPGARDAQRSIARQYEPACSGVVLYLGLDRQYEMLAHHNFFFSTDSQREFGQIYREGVPTDDPTLYICAPSRSEPDQAPGGGEALYVLIHTPWRRADQRWEGEGGLFGWYRRLVLEKMERMGLEDLQRHIVTEGSLTPDTIESMYNAEGGAIYGLASHGRLKGGFKPRNRSRTLEGLYFAGGSVNPGPGVPMVVMSGVTAARAAAEDLGLGESETDGSSYTASAAREWLQPTATA